MRNETFQEAIRFVITELTLLNYDGWYFVSGYTKPKCSEFWIDFPIDMAEFIMNMLTDCNIMYQDTYLARGPSKVQINAYWGTHIKALKEKLMLWTIRDLLETR